MPRPPECGLSVRVSVTDRCPLRCVYCMPPEGIVPGPRAALLTYEEIATLIGWLEAAFGVRQVRITGGEPLVRRHIERLIERLAGLGIPDLALTTNGVLLAARAAALRTAGLHRINISLDAIDPAVYRRITGGGDVRDALRGIDAALGAGLHPVRLNAVAIAGVNETDWIALARFAIGRGCELRFIEAMPIGPLAAVCTAGFVPAAVVREHLATSFRLTPVAEHQPGASARRYAVETAAGARGTVGFITSRSEPFCGSCARLRVTADGRFIGCLARERAMPFLDMLRRGDSGGVVEAARAALLLKRTDGTFAQPGAMHGIGG